MSVPHVQTKQEIERLLSEAGVRPRKRFGQNFLIDGNLMRRVENDNLPYLTTAVLIQRQTGGNLAELMDRLSAMLRERTQFTGRVRAMTAQGRGAATFLALWLPFIICLVWMMAPDYLRPLFENRWGHYTLAAAFGLDGLAYYMALRIADVEA